MIDIQKWFSRWKLEKYLERTEINWKEVEADVKASLWEKWVLNPKSSKFEYYSQTIMHYTKHSFTEEARTAHAYLTEAVTRAQRSAIGQIRMRSHSLELEKGA